MTPKTADKAITSLEVAELDLERLPLPDVSPHPMNARVHTKEQIKAIQESYRLDKYIAGSMCIQKSTRMLYKGHAVYEALYGLGVQEADFVVKDLTDAETLALLARDNALSDMSTNDPVKLKAISVELQEMDVEIQRMGYTLKEITSMQPRKEVEEDDPPPVSEEKPVTKMGDLWRLGNHRVLCGDSTRKEDVERVMGGEKADMVFTDPPYGMGKDFENDSLSDMREFHSRWMATCPICAGYLIWYDPKNMSDIIVPGEEAWGHMIDYLHLYKPNDVAFPRQSWIRISESMIVFGSPEYIEVKPYAHDTYVWNHEGKDKSFYHPSVKPMTVVFDVLSRLGGRAVFDPFLGSGTTLIACSQLDRVCVGLEISEKYCDVIIKRYINHAGSDEHVTVERKGKTLTWKQAQLPKVV
jgi:DNA modification methylase